MLSSAEAGDETMSPRIDALMSALNIKQASDRMLTIRVGNELSGLKYIKAGALTVRHQHMSGDDENNIDDELTFSNENGEVIALAKVKYKKTARGAQLALFEELTMNSLPTNLLLERFEVDKTGPGSLCVVDKLKNRVHFIRRNVAVSVRSGDSKVDVRELARQMDQILIGER